MATAKRVKRAQNVVTDWVEKTMGWGSERVDIIHVPHLCTPQFDFFVLAQVGLMSAGELYAMTDGREVLPSNPTNLSQVLVREGFLQEPAVIPAKQFGELYFKMAEVRSVRLIEDPDDWALAPVSPELRTSFSAPTVRRQGDDLLVTFWTSSVGPFRVHRWQVCVAPDGGLTHISELLG